MKKTCRVGLVHMGDSITFGQHIDPKLRWTSLVEARLASAYAETPIQINVLNRGVSGETTRLGLERFPSAVQNANLHVMTLQYGLNDCNCWKTDRGLPRVAVPAFRANLVEMITRARWFGVRQIVLMTNHKTLRRTIMISGEPYEDANARYNDILREVATETGVILCDIHKAFEIFTEQELGTLLLPYPDDLHLSIEGNRVYAELIWPFIEQAIKAVVQESQETAGNL